MKNRASRRLGRRACPGARAGFSQTFPLWVALIVLPGCKASSTSTSPSASSAPAPEALAAPSAPEADPTPEALANALFSGAHVLVSYQNATPCTCSFRLSPGVTRTYDEARALATRLRDDITAEPSRFATLAARHSDELYTREHGGSFGVLNGDSLPETVTVALAKLAPGALGWAESSLGFHILRRDTLLPATSVSGHALFIQHNESHFKAWESVTPPPARSRDEAFRLLSKLRRELQEKGPLGAFPELARQYSEGPRAADGGFLGTWSNRGPRLSYLLWMEMNRLAEGELSDIRNTPFGLALFLRVPAKPQPALAASKAFFPHDRVSPQAVQQLHAALRAHPDQFDSVMESEVAAGRAVEYLPRKTWERGTDLGTVELAVERVQVGQVAEPVDGPDGVFLLRREWAAPSFQP